MVSPRVRRIATKLALHHLRRQVADPALRERLTPDFELGCKRILISNDWYPAVSAPNVEVVSAGVREVRADSVVTTDGRELPADVIIFGTGFHVTDPPIAAHLRGRDGRTLAECWNGSPRTYLGVTVTNFPNLFRLGGAGSTTGHNSHVFQEECQVAYAMDALRLMRARGITSIEARAEEQRAYTEQFTARLAGTVWSVGGCKSWYQDASGVASVTWPAPTWEYRRATRRFDPAPYALRTAGRRARPRTEPPHRLCRPRPGIPGHDQPRAQPGRPRRRQPSSGRRRRTVTAAHSARPRKVNDIIANPLPVPLAARQQPDDMVWIPGGRFTMGSDRHYPEEARAHPVSVDGFWMDPHPVTNAQFQGFAEATGYRTIAERPADPAGYPGADPAMLPPASAPFHLSPGAGSIPPPE